MTKITIERDEYNNLRTLANAFAEIQQNTLNDYNEKPITTLDKLKRRNEESMERGMIIHDVTVTLRAAGYEGENLMAVVKRLINDRYELGRSYNNVVDKLREIRLMVKDAGVYEAPEGEAVTDLVARLIEGEPLPELQYGDTVYLTQEIEGCAGMFGEPLVFHRLVSKGVAQVQLKAYESDLSAWVRHVRTDYLTTVK